MGMFDCTIIFFDNGRGRGSDSGTSLVWSNVCTGRDLRDVDIFGCVHEHMQKHVWVVLEKRPHATKIVSSYFKENQVCRLLSLASPIWLVFSEISLSRQRILLCPSVNLLLIRMDVKLVDNF